MITASAADRMAMARSAQSRWANLSVRERCSALGTLRHTIAKRLDEIVALISFETGKPPLDALGGDLMVTLEQMRYYERHAHRVLAPHRVGKPPFFFAGTRFTEHYEPHGAVLIFAPWNYPFQLAVVPTITALVAGNAVLLKCSERTPLMAALIEELCREAALPAALVQVSCEPPERASALIDARPDFFFFTGSSSNGRIIAQRAALHLIPTALELGGKDACIVFAGCDLERTIEGAVYGAFSNAGQVCVGIKRIYIEQSIYVTFVSRFLERTRRLRIGESDHSDLGPIRFATVRQRLADQVEDAVTRGATLHSSWTRKTEMIPPLVLTDVPSDALILTEESFGPVVCMMPFQNEDESIVLANSTEFALSASIFTEDGKQARRVASRLNAGSCAINDVVRNIGNPHASFGGNAASGHGRYHGPAGLHTFSRIKSVMTTRRLHNPEIHWFPFTPRTLARTRGLLLARHRGGSFLRRLRSLRKISSLIVALLLLGAHCIKADQPAALVLDVQLPPRARGVLAYLVFASPNGFPSAHEKSVRHNFVPKQAAVESRQRIDVGALPPGHYAVAVFLDTNGNHKLDKTFLGIPKEPVGVSNNPQHRIGPPRFDDCSFVHGHDAQAISITLVHP